MLVYLLSRISHLLLLTLDFKLKTFWLLLSLWGAKTA